MLQAEKEPKERLWQLAFRVRMASQSSIPPSANVNDLAIVCARLIEGERDESAVQLIVDFGTVNMMAALHEVGLVSEAQWREWKDRLTPSDAELVLEWPDAWPHEVREWATVVVVQSL